MIRAIRAALDLWQDDPAVHTVVIEGAGERAFCAGGDIRWIRDMTIAGRHAETEALFVEEYALNLTIGRYPKPYVALIDGICMGGGIGLSAHGSVRVVSGAASLAMPETAIGFFPDVGASFILPRLRPGFGMYLGLSGARIDGAAAAYVGLATHYVLRERIASLADEIAEYGIAVLAEAAIPPPSSLMAAIGDKITVFNANSIADIMGGLISHESDWAWETLVALRAASPSALIWTHELLRLGAKQTLEACLGTELTLARHVSQHPDFREGIRAMVVDKDRAPRWSPSELADVDQGKIRKFFK